MRTGLRGVRQKIVDEELVRLQPGDKAQLYEVLACGHRQRGVYNSDGFSCDGKQNPVKSRICRGCLTGRPKGPPGEVVPP